MTKDEALDLALEALELSAVTVDSFGVQKKTQEAITAIKQALAAPVQPVQDPVAFEVSLVEWVGNKLMATPKTTTTPTASWVEMVTANLVREGVNKHKARELAEHFYSLAQPAPVQELTNIQRHEQNVQKFLAAQPAPVQEPVPDYAWPTVADYEKDVGFEVNDAFKMAWAMARTTNALFTQLEKP